MRSALSAIAPAWRHVTATAAVLLLGVPLSGCTVAQQEPVLGSTEQAVTWPSECFNPVPGTCTFYRDCLEAKFFCGDNGYPIGYGEKYCNLFINHTGFSAAALQWRDATLSCLQNALTGFMSYSVVPENPMCSTLESQAFESHPACYTQPGASICDLSVSDWVEVQGVIDVLDKISPRGAAQILATAKTCVSGWVGAQSMGSERVSVVLAERAFAGDGATEPSLASSEREDLARRIAIFSSVSTVAELRDALRGGRRVGASAAGAGR